MIAIKSAIESADHYSTKKQLLAIVAADVPSSTLRTHFPTVTDYQIKAARNHAYRCGEDVLQLRRLWVAGLDFNFVIVKGHFLPVPPIVVYESRVLPYCFDDVLYHNKSEDHTLMLK